MNSTQIELFFCLINDIFGRKLVSKIVRKITFGKINLKEDQDEN